MRASSQHTVLVVAHHHPEETTGGGGEICAYEHFKTLQTFDGIRSFFLFPSEIEPLREPSLPLTCISHYRRRSDEYYFPFEHNGIWQTSYDYFSQSRFIDAHFEKEFTKFLGELHPDIIHFHHYYRVGFEVITLARRVLPEAVICLTLHDYIAICPTWHMVRTFEERTKGGIKQLCSEATVQRCLQCCDDKSANELAARELYTRSSMDEIDLFFAPSRFLKGMYAGWHIPEAKIVYMQNSRSLLLPNNVLAADRNTNPTRFAFFGRATVLKGLDILLRAILILAEEGFSEAQFYINSAEASSRSEIVSAIEQIRSTSTCEVMTLGSYNPDELAFRMSLTDWVIVPSIWWENAPLVIEEAFIYGKPVICSNVGGMAERVVHGFNGLTFEVGDARELARTIRLACSNRNLWWQLRDHINRPPQIEETCGLTIEHYERVSKVKSGARRHP